MQDAAGLGQPCLGRDRSPETLRAAVCSGCRERPRGPALWAAAGPWLRPCCLPTPAHSPVLGALTAHRLCPVNHPALSQLCDDRDSGDGLEPRGSPGPSPPAASLFF